MPKSGIDLVLLFDLPDDVALKRAEGRTCKDFYSITSYSSKH